MCPELKPDRTPQKATKKKKKMVNTLGSRETRKLKSGKPFILFYFYFINFEQGTTDAAEPVTQSFGSAMESEFSWQPESRTMNCQ